jgi:hypothetical protein
MDLTSPARYLRQVWLPPPQMQGGCARRRQPPGMYSCEAPMSCRINRAWPHLPCKAGVNPFPLRHGLRLQEPTLRGRGREVYDSHRACSTVRIAVGPALTGKVVRVLHGKSPATHLFTQNETLISNWSKLCESFIKERNYHDHSGRKTNIRNRWNSNSRSV